MSSTDNNQAATDSDLAVETSSTGLKCGMEGFVQMVIEITELVLSVVTMFKEIIATVLPPDLAKSVKYAYQGLSGASSWLGFAVAAVYFLAKDQGYGHYLCKASMKPVRPWDTVTSLSSPCTLRTIRPCTSLSTSVPRSPRSTSLATSRPSE